MCCGIFGQGVKALSLDMNPYQVEKPHLVVVRFILRRGQTNVEIEIREFEGGVRATGLFCLLGVGVGLCTFLAYKLCSQLKYLISSSSVDNNSLQLSCLPSLNTQVLDSGISLGIKKLKKPGILHRSQLFESQPQIWRKRIIDWLARSSFPSEGGESKDDDEEDDEYKYESDQTANKLIKVKKFDPMMTSTQSGRSSGFVSNPDNAELSWNNNSFQYEGSKEWQSYGNEDELMDGIVEESEGHVSNQSQLGCNTNNHHQNARKNVPKYRRPNSGLSSSSSGGVRVGNKYGMKRNCYSFASCKSGDSSLYDYRDSLVSKGFSVDLGENLDAVMFPSNCEFVPSDQLSAHDDQDAVNHMDWLQYELMKIQLDIDCLNQKFDDLCQPKMNEPKHQIPEDFLTEKFQNAHPVDSRVQTPHEGTPDVETFDFIWDYHSDLAAVEQPSFISSRPGGDSFDGKYDGRVFEETGRFKMTQGIIDEEDDDDELVNDPLRDEIGNVSGLKGRRESIVLFYFDDDIDDGFMGIQRPHSVSNTSNQANIPQLNKKSSDSKNELQKSKCVSSSLLPSLDRIFQSGSPRHLKRSKAEQQTNINNNNACCIERIFSCEDRRIVGDEKKLFEHLESDLHVDVTQISNIRKGYSKVFELWGSSNVRSFRSERFSILGPITFHVLLHGLPILSDVGGNFQNSVQYLVAAIDNDHQYLMEWKYKGFLWAPKNEVLFKLINSLRIFCEQVCAVRRMMKKCREQYLVSLLNHSTDMEVHLVEALKIVIMLKVISLCKVTHKHPNLEELFGPPYASAELVFKNLINNVEDGTIFDDLQMSFLSAILGVRIEILSPTQCGSEGFMRSYPMMVVRDSNRWNKLSIIEDGPAFLYCLPALNNDE